MTDNNLSIIVGGVVAVCVGGLAAIPPTLLAWANLKQSEKSSAAAQIQRTATDVKIDTLTTKADTIHQLTNGSNESLTAQLREANVKIETLTRMVESLQGRLRARPPIPRKHSKP